MADIHDQINQWVDQLALMTQQVKDEFGTLDQAEFNWQPQPQAWSVGQVLEHLMLINSSYFPQLKQMRHGKSNLPFFASSGFMTKRMGRMILRSVQPDQQRKSRTLGIWTPKTSEVPADQVERFTQHQAVLTQEIKDSRQLLETGALVRSPASRWIVYRLETAFDILVAHEFRHFNQAVEVKRLYKKQ